MLKEHQINGQVTEQEYLEFKEGPVDYLQFRDEIFDIERFDRSLRARITKSICGALNSRSGWVFVGITDQGAIAGFPPIYLENQIPGQDYIQQLISENVRSIQPNPLEVERDCISMWAIDVGQNRIVLSVLITKPQGGIAFTYNGVCYGKFGTTCPRVRVAT